MCRHLDADRVSATPRKCHFIIEVLRIEYHRNASHAGCHFLEEFHPFGRHLISEKRNAGKILTWPSKRGGYSRPHWVVAYPADDGDVTFACLEQRLDHIAADGEQKGGLLRDKFNG